MPDNESVASANGQGPATIIQHEGKDYVLAPLLMKDLGTIEIYIKKLHRTETLAVIREAGDLLTPKEKAQWLRELAGGSVSQSEEGEGTEDEAVKWSWIDDMITPTVITFALTLRLQKTYPEMTQEQASAIISVKAIADMSEEMTSLLGLDAFISDEDGEAEPGEAQSG